jgi:hypothetical protein
MELHRTRLVCLGVSPSPRVRCLSGRGMRFGLRGRKAFGVAACAAGAAYGIYLDLWIYALAGSP